VSLFTRFDNSGEQNSDNVLAARWRSFHDEVQRHSSQPGGRLLALVFGHETRRRQWAQGLRDRLRPPRSSTAHADSFLAHRSRLALRVDAAADELVDHDYALVAVDPHSPSGALAAMRLALASNYEWILISDNTQALLASSVTELWRRREDGDVIFGDLDDDPWPQLGSAALGPHSLLSENLVTRPTLVRREIITDLAVGLRAEAGDAWEWDLMLQLCEAKVRFVHVPLLLGVASGAMQESSDQQRVVAEALARRGVTTRVEVGARPGLVSWNIERDDWPMVDIIIPTRDRVDLVGRCIESIERLSTYPAYRITILDNDSVEPATLDYFASTRHHVLACPGPFNYAAIMNRGVAATEAGLVVMINNDTTVVTPDWLERMVGVALLEDVGAVGCLQTNNGVHDHDGVIIAPYPQHLRWGTNWFANDRYVLARRNVSAVTGAVMMVRRDRWESVGGMDEGLAVVMNDVDFCLRVQNEGAYVVYLPDVQFEHQVSSSRGRLDPLADRNAFLRRWDILGSFQDPYFPERLRLYGTTIDVAGSD